ncbi:MAG: DUF503 domain-containing protein [Bacillota bacterium]
MFIASVRLELSIPHAHSLKTKRMLLNSLMDKVRHRFGAAVAEVAEQELWQRAVVGIALVSGESTHVREMADRVIGFVESHWEGEVCTIDVEIL